MEVMTYAFKNQGKIPDRYVMSDAGGDNVSMPVSWTDPPKGTASFALIMVDSNAASNNGIHWMVTNIPADVRSFQEGASGQYMPLGAVEHLNSFGNLGYDGPQPHQGSGGHRYITTVFALNVPNVHPGAKPTLAEFMSSIHGKVLEEASVTGIFEQDTPLSSIGVPISGETVCPGACSGDRRGRLHGFRACCAA